MSDGDFDVVILHYMRYLTGVIAQVPIRNLGRYTKEVVPGHYPINCCESRIFLVLVQGFPANAGWVD